MRKVDNKKGVAKFFLSGLVLFSLALVFITLRDFKVILIVTSAYGPELIPSLDIYALIIKFILAGLFYLIYRRDNLPQILFYSSIILIISLVSFHFWGVQNTDLLHPDVSIIQELTENNPMNAALYSAYGIWTYSAYYILADIWGTFTIGLLFWAFANQTFSFKEAKLSYPLLTLFPGVAILLSGPLIMYDMNQATYAYTGGYILIAGLVLFIVGSFFIKRLNFSTVPTIQEEMPKINLLTRHFKWKYFFLIFLLIVAFEITSHFSGLIFKSHMRYVYPAFEGYNKYLNDFSYYSGILSVLLFLVTFWLIWLLGWLRSSLILPIAVMLSVGCLSIYLLKLGIGDGTDSFSSSTNIDLLWLFGFLSIFISGLKTLFFSLKEMAFIPLAVTTKARGKVLVDYLLFGIISTSLIPFIIVIFDLIPFEDNIINMLVIILATSIIWLVSILSLGKMIKSLTNE